MIAKIKRIDTSLPLPKYETSGSVGFDFFCRESITIFPKRIELIPGNVIIQIPAGYMLMITLRSSTPQKYRLIMPHGVGIIDCDYCGPNDEILIQVMNITEDPVTVNRGDRIAQGIFVKVDRTSWLEVMEIQQESRGGFGSTDEKDK